MRQPAWLADWLGDPQLCQVVQLLETDLSNHQSRQYLSVLLDGKLNTLLTPVVERIVGIGHPGYGEIWDAPERSQAARRANLGALARAFSTFLLVPVMTR